MQMKTIMLVMTLVLSAHAVQAAVDGYVATSLSNAAKLSGGSWTDAKTWDPEGEPSDNARITLGPLETYYPTLTLEKDVSREYRLLFFALYNTDTSITIDGAGHSLTLPASSAGYYENTAFNTYSGNRYLFSISDNASGGKLPVLSWTNPLLTVGCDGSRSYLHFNRGTFNFRDIDGATSTRPITVAKGPAPAGSTILPMSICVSNDTRFVAGSLFFQGYAQGDEIVFDGGLGDISAMSVSDTDAATPHAFALRLTNDAEVVLGSFTDSHAASAAGPVTFSLDVADSTLAVTNGDFALLPSAYAKTDFRLLNSTLAITNGCALFGGNSSHAHTVSVDVVSSAIRASSALTLGAKSGSGKSNRTAASFQNSTLDAYSIDVCQGADVTFSGTTLDFTHNPGVVTNLIRNGASVTIYGNDATTDLKCLSVGCANPDDSTNLDSARLVLDGGSFAVSVAKAVTGVGCMGKATGLLILTNGTTMTVSGSSETPGFSIGGAPGVQADSNGRMEIYDSTFQHDSSSAFSIGDWVASTSAHSSSGYLKVGAGGVVNVNDSATFSIGRCTEAGTLEICDGASVVASHIIMENNSFHYKNPSVTNRIIQTGGTLTLSRLTLANGSCRCEAHFLGGKTTLYNIVAGSDLAEGRDGAAGVLYGNGGTIVARGTLDPFISGMTDIACGPKGLIIDTNGKTVGIRQDISDMSGATGLLKVTGGGTAILAPTSRWTVSKTSVENSTVSFANASVSLETELALTRGSTLTLAGTPTALTLSALTVNGGTLVIDPGDVIQVPAEKLNLTDLRIKYVTEAKADATNSLFVVSGTLSAANRAAITAALECTRTLSSAIEVLFETEGDVTQVKTVRRNAAAPLAAETVWQGASADGWNTSSSWTDGVPTAETKAIFGAAGSRAVTVPSGATVGALSFSADGYVLSGTDALSISAKDGAAVLSQTAGSAEISAPLTLAGVIAVTNDANTSLTLSGNVTDGGFAKIGTGELRLTGENSFTRQVSVGGGNTIVRSMSSIVNPVAKNPIVLAGDTLWISNDTDAAETVLNPVILRTPTLLRNAVIRNDTDVTLENFSVEQGGLAKRGSGKLTIEVHDGMDLAPTKRSSGMTWAYKKDFGVDGTVPDNTKVSDSGFIGAFAVAEGETVFRPAAGESKPTLKFSNDSLSVGMQVSDHGMARCTVDGVKIVGDGKVLVGYNLQSTGGIMPNFTPELHLLNGAEINVPEFYHGTSIFYMYNHPLLTVTNAQIVATTSFTISGRTAIQYAAQSELSSAVVRTKDADLLSDTFIVGQGVDARFVSTRLAPRSASSATLYAKFGENETVATHGTMLFENDSVMKVNSFVGFNLVTNWYNKVDTAVFTLAFDDATWDYGAGDYTLAADTFSKYVRFQMNGKGLRLAPTAGTTFMTEFPFSGEGGLIIDGEGTVKFGADTLQFSGMIDLRSGTLDLTEAGPLGNVPLMGSGTVKGGSFAGMTMKAGGALKFDGTSFGSCLVVDFGRTAENPMDPKELAEGVEIATIVGSAPVLPVNAYAINTGIGLRRMRGSVRVSGDKLIASFIRRGTFLFMR